MAMHWYGSYDFTFAQIDTVENCTQISCISKEQDTLLKEHINYHDKIKRFLEICLYKGQTEGSLAASVMTAVMKKIPWKLRS